LQDPPKFFQIWIFGLKTNHLATLHEFIPGVRAARFILVQLTKTRKLPNGRKIDQHLPLRYPPNFNQIGIFGLKSNHLAIHPGSQL
jgi:hypothetical protein